MNTQQFNWEAIAKLSREQLDQLYGDDDGTVNFQIVTAGDMENFNEDGTYDGPDVMDDYEATMAIVQWFEANPDGFLLQHIWNDTDWTAYEQDGTIVAEYSF